MIARAIIKCRLSSLEESLPIHSRLKRSTQRWHVNGVIAVDLVTSVRIIVADTVLDTHGHLYGIRSIRACVIIPATATGIEFAPIQWQNRAIGRGRRGRAPFTRQNADLLNRTDATATGD